MKEKLQAAVVQFVPVLRQLMADRTSLEGRLAALSDGGGETSLDLLPMEVQVAYLRAGALTHLAAMYIGNAVSNLAHCPEAFAQIEDALDPGIPEHARDSAADEVAFAPDLGVTADAAIVAALSSIEGDVKLAQDHLTLASQLLSAVSH